MRAWPAWARLLPGTALLLLLLLSHGAWTHGTIFSSSVEDTVFTPGISPLDQMGHRVEAHGGCLLQHSGAFWWFGESKKVFAQGDWLSEGIALYSSPDLAAWTAHGLVLKGSDIRVPGRSPPFRLERPKVVRCPSTQQWVLYLHLDLPNFAMSAVGVATSPLITGPFTYLHAFKPDTLDSYDITLFQDDNGVGYLVRSVENRFTGISALTPDYLNTTGGLLSRGPQMEGQALFKHRGRYFLMGSHLTGWSPNPLMLFQAQLPSASRPDGEWKLAGATWARVAPPTSGPDASTTYNSQPTCVVPVMLPSNQVLLLYMGDRWNYRGPGSLHNASYVWLPLLPTPVPPSATLSNTPSSIDPIAPFWMPFMASWRIREYIAAHTA